MTLFAGACSVNLRTAIAESESCARSSGASEPRLLPPRSAASAAPRFVPAQLTDGRDSYYVLELSHCGELLAATGVALHPGLGSSRHRWTLPGASHAGGSASCSSAPATARARNGRGTRRAPRWRPIHAHSAGSHPKPLHPNAVRVMRERWIDIGRRRSKHMGRVRRPAFRLCDQPLRPRPEVSPRGPTIPT